MAAAKGKVTLVLADYQRRGLAQEAKRFGVGISEFLRRAFDDPAVQAAIRAMPMYQNPPDYLPGGFEVSPPGELTVLGGETTQSTIRRVSRA